MTWREWVENKGTMEVAYKLGLSETTVRTWIREETNPSDKVKKRLVRLAKGAIKYADFFK